MDRLSSALLRAIPFKLQVPPKGEFKRIFVRERKMIDGIGPKNANGVAAGMSITIDNICVINSLQIFRGDLYFVLLENLQ